MQVDLTSAIESVTFTIAPDVERAGIRLRSAVAAGLRVSADPSLERALEATLLDVVRASPKGTEIWLTADRETDACTLRLSGAPWSGSSRLMEEAVLRSDGQLRLVPSAGEMVVRLGRC
jgi:hypothetical protein